MASTAVPNTLRHRRKANKLKQTRLTERVIKTKKSPVGKAIMKEAFEKGKLHMQKELETMVQKSNMHMRRAVSWRMSATSEKQTNEQLQLKIKRLRHKVSFADRRLSEKNQSIDILLAANRQLEKKKKTGARHRY